MSISGDCIVSVEDELGSIFVYQNKTHRILSFDGHIEQSCISLQSPEKLMHNYTQAMISALLFKPILKNITIMGLGAGSLVHKFIRHSKVSKIHAVEYRQKVIELAQQYFYLPETPRLKFHNSDAIKYIQDRPAKTDIIFSDLYNSNGMEPRQLQLSYLDHCKSALKPEGILVLNFWQQDFNDNKEIEALLAETFNDQIISFTVEGGNTIVFAFKELIPIFSQSNFMRQGKLMEEVLQTPMLKYAKLIWRQQSYKFNQKDR